MHITLYRKYRPKTFEEIAGETEIVSTLKNSLKNNRTSHAYLFTGPRGVGKTTVARLIAKGVNCLNLSSIGEPCNNCSNCNSINNGMFLDLIEIDAASNRGIDEIRLLKDKINYQPSEGKKKVYIIDEVHMLTKEAFNALLKTLEEPPDHVIFILATTEPEKILPTIISRCQRYNFKTLSSNEMKEKLKFIASEEQIDVEENVFPLIYEASSGSMRDAISILERLVITCFSETITEDKTHEILGITSTKQLDSFLKKIVSNDSEFLINKLDNMWNSGVEIEKFFKDLAKYSKNLILSSEFKPNILLNIIEQIYGSISHFKFEEDKRLVGYVIISRLLQFPKSKSIEEDISSEIIEDKISKPKTSAISPEKKVENSFNINQILQKWPKICEVAQKEKVSMGIFLLGAKPFEIEGDTLNILYKEGEEFSKELMEEPVNNIFLATIIENILGERLKLTYSIESSKKKEDKSKENFTKKIISYFEGEEI